MKKILLLLCLTLSSFLASQEGLGYSVLYESFVKYEFEEGYKLDSFDKAMLASSETPAYYELQTNKNQSTFKHIERVNNSQKDDNSTITVSTVAPVNIFKDLNKQYYLIGISAFNDDYLIKDTLKKIDWKIFKENRKILGLKAQKATAKVDSTTSLVAWYTTKIPIKNGPDIYAGLPGLILELAILIDDTPQEITTYRATELKKMTPPINITQNKGTVISKEAFINKQNEYLNKMNDMNSGGVDTD